MGEVADGEAAREALRREEPDVALLDITMEGATGIELCEELRKADLPTRVLILSMHDDPEYLELAIAAGADGYLLKDEAGPAELRRAVRAVHAGRSVFSGRLTRGLARAARERRERTRTAEAVTPREREVLALVADGLTSREIADRLQISPRTVETHRENLMRKLEVRSAAALARVAVERGLLPDDA